MKKNLEFCSEIYSVKGERTTTIHYYYCKLRSDNMAAIKGGLTIEEKQEYRQNVAITNSFTNKKKKTRIFKFSGLTTEPKIKWNL